MKRFFKPTGISLIVAMLFMVFTVSAVATSQAEGLVVKSNLQTDYNGTKYAEVTISYNGLSVNQTERQENLQVAGRTSYDGGKKWGPWVPMTAYAMQDDGKESLMPVYADCKMQFCVTSLPFPRMPYFSQDLTMEAKENGTLTNVTVATSYTEKAQPFPITATPALTSTYNVNKLGKKAGVSVRYDQKLEQIGDIYVEVLKTSGDTLRIDGVTYENIWQDKLINGENYGSWYCLVKFDMTFDDSNDGQGMQYTFKVNGLQGSESKKAPKEFPYITTLYDCSQLTCATYHDCNDILYLEQPNLLKNGAVDANYKYQHTSKFETSVLLVATKNGASKTFTLSHNNSDIASRLRNGAACKLAVPSPAGYNYKDSSVKYTAYFNKYDVSTKSYNLVELPIVVNGNGIMLDFNVK